MNINRWRYDIQVKTKQEQIDQWSKLHGRQISLEVMAQKWHSKL